MIVDAYAHCGSNRYLPIDQLEMAMDTNDIDACLLVQHMGEFDNGYLASIVRKSPKRYGAICLVDTTHNDAPQQLELLLTGNAKEADGVRFLGARMTADMMAESPQSLDVLNRHKATLVVHLPQGIGVHLALLERLACDFSDLIIYVPHMGWPRINGQPSPAWQEAIRTLSQYPAFAFGLSAMYHFSSEPFPHKDVWPHMQDLVAAVGADRVVWASDFPLLLDKESLADNLKLFSEGLIEFTPNEREAILGESACRFWKLGT